jgi:hypothetical protein
MGSFRSRPMSSNRLRTGPEDWSASLNCTPSAAARSRTMSTAPIPAEPQKSVPVRSAITMPAPDPMARQSRPKTWSALAMSISAGRVTTTGAAPATSSSIPHCSSDRAVLPAIYAYLMWNAESPSGGSGWMATS